VPAIPAVLESLTSLVKAVIDAVATLGQPVFDALAPSVQTVIDAVSAAFEHGGAALMTECFLTRCAVIEAGFDAISTLVQTLFDALAARVQPVLDAIATSVQPVFDPIAAIGGKCRSGGKQHHPGDRGGEKTFHGVSLLAGTACTEENAYGRQALTADPHNSATVMMPTGNRSDAWARGRWRWG
jgi:Flp pilus assembly pilin Flp